MAAVVTTPDPKQVFPQDILPAFFKWLGENGPRLIFGIAVFFIGLWVIRFLKTKIRGKMSTKQVHSSLQPFFLSLSITLLHIVLIIVVMEIMGIQLTIFTTVIGAMGVAAGLALSGTLQNFAGGVLILLLKPFTIDDNIVAQGVDGYVTSIEVFYTEVLTHDNKAVIIPNGKLFNEVIINVTREGKRRLDLDLKFPYSIDMEKAQEIIRDSIKKTQDILPDTVSYVGIMALEIDGVRLTVRVWVQVLKYTTTKFSLYGNILADLKAAGIKLPGMS